MSGTILAADGAHGVPVIASTWPNWLARSQRASRRAAPLPYSLSCLLSFAAPTFAQNLYDATTALCTPPSGGGVLESLLAQARDGTPAPLLPLLVVVLDAVVVLVAVFVYFLTSKVGLATVAVTLIQCAAIKCRAAARRRLGGATADAAGAPTATKSAA